MTVIPEAGLDYCPLLWGWSGKQCGPDSSLSINTNKIYQHCKTGISQSSSKVTRLNKVKHLRAGDGAYLQGRARSCSLHMQRQKLRKTPETVMFVR
jgi:hypothetical protein